MHAEEEFPKVIFSSDNIKQIVINENESILQYEDHLRYHYTPANPESEIIIENKGYIPVTLTQYSKDEQGTLNLTNILSSYQDIFNKSHLTIPLGEKTTLTVFTTRKQYKQSLQMRYNKQNILQKLLNRERTCMANENKNLQNCEIESLSVVNFDDKEYLLISSLGHVEYISKGMITRYLNQYVEYQNFFKKVSYCFTNW